jgi:predicted metal-dependent phosphoesterase TrpH
MRNMAADLHIHTALSPCADREMTPPAVVDTALAKGLGIIAVCDHNSAGNIAATQQAAGRRISVLAGIEICTSEEVHVVGLFPSAGEALAVAEEIRDGLPESWIVSGRFEQQFLVDKDGRQWGLETRMLSASCALTLSETVELIKEYGGLAVAAHVDRPAFGVIGQLGLLPQDVEFDALEVSAVAPRKWANIFCEYGFPVITSSDAHFLSAIGASNTLLRLLEPTFSELTLALQGVDGRACTIA